jgi:hypothetical protein
MRAIFIFLILNIAMYLVVSFIMWDIVWILKSATLDIGRRAAVVFYLILYQILCYLAFKMID